MYLNSLINLLIYKKPHWFCVYFLPISIPDIKISPHFHLAQRFSSKRQQLVGNWVTSLLIIKSTGPKEIFSFKISDIKISDSFCKVTHGVRKNIPYRGQIPDLNMKKITFLSENQQFSVSVVGLFPVGTCGDQSLVWNQHR